MVVTGLARWRDSLEVKVGDRKLAELLDGQLQRYSLSVRVG